MKVGCTFVLCKLMPAVVAEWLRRLTRNQFPSGSVGSNPTDCENLFFFTYLYARPYIRGQVYIRHCVCIVGSVVECSPATRAARVRFPDDAIIFPLSFHPPWPWLHFLQTLNVPGLVGSKTHSVCKKVFWRRGVSIPVPLTC